MKGFLGFGLVHPFRRDHRNDFVAAGDAQLVRASIAQILGTLGGGDDGAGELPWRTEFGSQLYLLRHQKNDAVLSELARVYIVDALARWEPRVVVRSAKVTREANVLTSYLRYDIIANNVPGNDVVVAGVEQVVVLA